MKRRNFVQAMCASAAGMAVTRSSAADWMSQLPLIGGAPRAAVRVCLVDTSATVAREDVDRLYRPSMEAWSRSIGPDDWVYLSAIGERPRERFLPDLELRLTRKGVRLDDAESVKRARERVNTSFAALLAAKAAQKSHLLDPLRQVQECFDRAPKSYERQLVVLSDGIEESRWEDFTKPGLDASRVSSLMKRLQEADHVPALQGVQVWFVGASGSQFANVERWWRLYFDRAGAKLAGYGRLSL